MRRPLLLLNAGKTTLKNHIINISWRRRQPAVFCSCMLSRQRAVRSIKYSNLTPSHILTCWFYHFYARSCAVSPDSIPLRGWFTVLTYFSSHSFISSPFLCLCLLEASRRPGLLLRGATGAPGRVLCSPCAVLLVTGVRRARAPTTGFWKDSGAAPIFCLGD